MVNTHLHNEFNSQAKASDARLASPEGVYPKFALANEDSCNAADEVFA